MKYLVCGIKDPVLVQVDDFSVVRALQSHNHSKWVVLSAQNTRLEQTIQYMTRTEVKVCNGMLFPCIACQIIAIITACVAADKREKTQKMASIEGFVEAEGWKQDNMTWFIN